MKVLITGAGGQLAYDLIKVLSSYHECFALTKKELDVTSSDETFKLIQLIHPDVIVHTAAYTDVDQAESCKELVFQINALGTRNVANAAALVDAKLVYISTDYVFDGNKGSPYTEWDRPNPLSVYGHSKLEGEKWVAALHDKYFILRTAWLFGKNGVNFVNKMVSLMQERHELQIVSDQIGSPTYSHDLAAFIFLLIETEQYGTYHTVNKGHCSRYEFVEAIRNAANMNHIILLPVKLKQFQLAATRPLNSALDDFRLRSKQLPLFRSWQSALQHYISHDLTT